MSSNLLRLANQTKPLIQTYVPMKPFRWTGTSGTAEYRLDNAKENIMSEFTKNNDSLPIRLLNVCNAMMLERIDPDNFVMEKLSECIELAPWVAAQCIHRNMNISETIAERAVIGMVHGRVDESTVDQVAVQLYNGKDMHLFRKALLRAHVQLNNIQYVDALVEKVTEEKWSPLANLIVSSYCELSRYDKAHSAYLQWKKIFKDKSTYGLEHLITFLLAEGKLEEAIQLFLSEPQTPEVFVSFLEHYSKRADYSQIRCWALRLREAFPRFRYSPTDPAFSSRILEYYLVDVSHSSLLCIHPLQFNKKMDLAR
ncbi:hypothetical protein PROFUN_01056 [Planoprotostelium fungivorum]|uniref:Pentatricopeptide repeat-containing protein n=2 Tax=Planoprotostelium fungivorum TaxID=1890364 RepID=A0A2P6N4L2_9EUKA|nr:hypothetical protein PROFUN_14540 [Planoprotostelium fungivorum]PRP78883.1 hypothetical protein PROFUN_01056 [Planoprotostelium fungivorum]